MIKTIGNAKEVVQQSQIPVYTESLGDGAVDCSQFDHTGNSNFCPTTL